MCISLDSEFNKVYLIVYTLNDSCLILLLSFLLLKCVLMVSFVGQMPDNSCKNCYFLNHKSETYRTLKFRMIGTGCAL